MVTIQYHGIYWSNTMVSIMYLVYYNAFCLCPMIILCFWTCNMVIMCFWMSHSNALGHLQQRYHALWTPTMAIPHVLDRYHIDMNHGFWTLTMQYHAIPIPSSLYNCFWTCMMVISCFLTCALVIPCFFGHVPLVSSMYQVNTSTTLYNHSKPWFLLDMHYGKIIA